MMRQTIKNKILFCCVTSLFLLSSCASLLSAEGAENAADALAEAEFSIPVSESEAVDDTYFTDCAFIGHSLIHGFQLYSGIAAGDFYAVDGISTKGLLDYSNFTLPDGSTGTLEDALSQTDYKAVYIMQGINEISSDTGSFYDYLTQLVELVKEYQPETIVYLISVTPTTQEKSENSVFNRENIIGFNDTMQQIAEEQEVYYLDLYRYFANEDGYLPDEYTWDGLHLIAEQYISFYDYLKTHTAS